MKKQLCTVLTVIASAAGFLLHGVDIPVVNSTPFKIVKYQIEDENEKKTNFNFTIPPGATKKISFPGKGVDTVTFFFDNGMKHSPGIAEIKDVRKIKFTHKGVYELSAQNRVRRTRHPAGQIRLIYPKDVKTFTICPLGRRDEWSSCPAANAQKNLYTAPKSGKYIIKITTSNKDIPEKIFNNKGKGYDLGKIAGFSVAYKGLESDVDEEGTDDEEED